jgi:radical SAM superfamily enzyme YgiQ (UPF0313 family)
MHLLYLAAALRARGYVPSVIDANAFRMRDDEILREVRSAAPLLVGLPVYSEILKQVRDITVRISRELPGVPVVLGGPHATAVPEQTLSQFSSADHVLAGEAEESLPALCDALCAGTEVSGIPGLYNRAKTGAASGLSPGIPDINTIPHPARDLVARAYDEKRYYSILVRQRPLDTLFTSRGCPFHCGFCYNFRFQYRARSPGDVVQEMAAIRDGGIRNIEICDDTFTINEDHAAGILDLVIAEKLDVSLRIKSRVDVFTENLARKAKQAGVYLVAFGMESGSQRILDAMSKGITLEESARACELARRYGILSHSSWVLGYPGETLETVEETMRFILKNRPDTLNMDVLLPYPNTPAYETAQSAGTLMGEWSPDAEELPWVRLPWAPERRLLDAACRKVLRRVTFSPHYIGSFSRIILRNANLPLFRYALQETMNLCFRGKRLR